MNVFSPIVSGSGATIVHLQLQSALNNYSVQLIDPRLALFPPLLRFHKKKADIIHTFPDMGPYLYEPHDKVVLTFHNFYLDPYILQNTDHFRRAFYNSILRPTVKKALNSQAVITAVSNYTAALVNKWIAPKKSVYVIENGVDVTKFHPVKRQERDSNEVRILFAGNPSRRKGLEVIHKVAEALPSNCKVYITNGLRNKQINLQSNKVIAIPAVPHTQMPELYRSVDILFFPTLREGMSLVALEAMACELPVVTTNCSSMPELIEHDKGGFLSRPGDVRAMVQHLTTLARNKLLMQDMGSYNHERVNTRYTLNRMILQYQDLFDSLK